MHAATAAENAAGLRNAGSQLADTSDQLACATSELAAVRRALDESQLSAAHRSEAAAAELADALRQWNESRVELGRVATQSDARQTEIAALRSRSRTFDSARRPVWSMSQSRSRRCVRPYSPSNAGQDELERLQSSSSPRFAEPLQTPSGIWRNV